MSDGARIGHPCGIDISQLTETGNILDGLPLVDYGTDFATVTYSFANGAIQLGSEFNVGATQYCANDNFVVPIPGAIYLLGAGLVSLMAIRRKKAI